MFRVAFAKRSVNSGVNLCAYTTASEGAAKSRSSSFSRLVIYTPPVLLGAWIATSESPKATASLALSFPIRLGRDVLCAASIVADYKRSLQGLEGESYETAKQQCHLRSADKLQRLCFANGGIYIKLGQVAAQLDHLLPEEYVATMRLHMLDKCPESTYSQVVRTITSELGAPPSTLYAEFDEHPVASASLAQVHRAVSHEGEELAVKVQHPGLLDSYRVDVATVSVLVRLIHILFPQFDYKWLVEEIRNTLPQELDFLQEAENAERCKLLFQDRASHCRGRIHIPKVYQDLCATRVLTMEFIRGLKVTDREALVQRGIDPQEVAQLVSTAFNEMIFIFGDVHCDPHAANMFVERDARGQPSIVILDHGLYKQLDDAFRLEYAALWQALVLGDEEGIKRHTAGMNAGEMFPLFAAMLTQRPWEDITRRSADHLHIPGGKAEREMLQARARGAAREINALLGRMPRDLLLLLKTNDCLRAVDLALGQPVNTSLITARACSRALARHRLQTEPGLRSWLAVQVTACRTEYRLWLLRVYTWLAGAQATLRGVLHLQ